MPLISKNGHMFKMLLSARYIFLTGVKLCTAIANASAKGPFMCISNLKIHPVIKASSTETAAPALP